MHLMRTFDAAARSPSFSIAADRLGVTQPAVSQQVRQLESMVGHPLFVRLGRGVELTEAGQQLAADVAPAMKLLERGWARFDTSGDDKRLTIRGNNTLIVRWLIPRLGGFLDANPDVDVDLDASFWPEPATDSAAVVLQAGPLPGGAVMIPGDQRLVAIASPTIADTVSWPDVSGCTLLEVRGSPGWAAFSDTDATQQLIGARRRVTSITHLHTIEMAAKGHGIAMAHHLTVNDLVERGELQVLATAATPSPEPYYAVFPRRDQLTIAADEFRRWLLTQ